MYVKKYIKEFYINVKIYSWCCNSY